MLNNCVSCKPGTPLPKCSVKIDGECVYYSGEFISGPDIHTGENLNSVVQKLVAIVPGQGVTSVGLAVPSAFTVSGSPITSSGTITISGAGTTAQYIRGDGSLATFPSPPTIPVLGAANGLSMSGTNVVLGGTLAGATTINTSSFNLAVTGAVSFGTLMTLTNTGVFSHVGLQVTVATGSNGTGIKCDLGTNAGSAIVVNYTGASASGNGILVSGGAGTGVNVTSAVVALNALSSSVTSPAMTVRNSGGWSAAQLNINGTTPGSPLIIPAMRILREDSITGGGASVDFIIRRGGSDFIAGAISASWQQVITLPAESRLDLSTVEGGIGALPSSKMHIRGNGNVGIGVSLSAAKLNIVGGTTDFPTILLNSGTLTATPVNGAIEYDGTNFWITTSGVRSALAAGGGSSIYTTDGALTNNRTVDMDGFPITWNDAGLFRITEGNVTVGGTYDFNDGVDFLAYDAANSSNLVLNSGTGMTFEYVDIPGVSVLSSLGVDGTGIKLVGIQEFADNAAAITGGLTAGYLYRTGDALKIVH